MELPRRLPVNTTDDSGRGAGCPCSRTDCWPSPRPFTPEHHGVLTDAVPDDGPGGPRMDLSARPECDRQRVSG